MLANSASHSVTGTSMTSIKQTHMVVCHLSQSVTTHTGCMHQSLSVTGLQSTVNCVQVQVKPKRGATSSLEVARSDQCPVIEDDKKKTPQLTCEYCGPRHVYATHPRGNREVNRCHSGHRVKPQMVGNRAQGSTAPL